MKLPKGKAFWAILAWLTEGARLFASLPYAAVQLPPFPLWLLLGYYAIVAGSWLANSGVWASRPVSAESS